MRRNDGGNLAREIEHASTLKCNEVGIFTIMLNAKNFVEVSRRESVGLTFVHTTTRFQTGLRITTYVSHQWATV